MTKDELQNIWKQMQQDIKGTPFENNVYMVGGCVRDFILNTEITDIDIAVSMPNGGKDFAEWYTKKYNCNSDTNPVIYGRAKAAKFSIDSPLFKNVKFEAVQTMLNLISTVPDKTDLTKNIGSIADDAMCRDFTCNAMYIDISGGMLLDPLQGLDEISDHIISTTSSPDAIFADDPLRMMRAIRFASKYKWAIDKRTWFGILKNCNKIKEVSVERIRDEFNQILLLNEPSIALERLLNSGLLLHIFPQLYALNRIGKGYNYSIPNQWKHTLLVVDMSYPTLLNRLSSLFHDIGKLTTFSFNGIKVKYPSHEQSGLIILQTALNKYKYPKSIVQTVSNIVEKHMVFDASMKMNTLPKDKNIRQLIDKFGDDFDTFCNVIISNILAKGDKYLNYACDLQDKIDMVYKEMAEAKSKPSVVLPINGEELIKTLNLKSGPIIGSILEKIKTAMYEKPNLSKEEALEIAKNSLVTCES